MTVETGEPKGDETQSEHSTEVDDTNVALKCVYQNDLETLQACFEDRENEEDPLADKMPDIIKERCESGKSPLDMAVMLGRVDVAKELITRGADVNGVTKCQGYGPLHLAAAWGRIDCLKVLIESGCDLHLRSANKGRAREIALRFNQTECVDFLDWAESKEDLTLVVSQLKETLNDPEKVQGRLPRDEKVACRKKDNPFPRDMENSQICNNSLGYNVVCYLSVWNSTMALCNEKLEWLETTQDATTENFITQKQEFDKAVADIKEKLEAPLPEKPEKK